MKTWKCGCTSPRAGMIVPCPQHSKGKAIRCLSARLRRMAQKKGTA